MIYTCLIYGLGLQVNCPIAGLLGLPPAPQVDVCLWMGSMPADLCDRGPHEAQEFYVRTENNESCEPLLRVSRVRDGKYLRLAYSDGTIFVIDAKYWTIWATWPQSATVEDTATYLLGPVLGYLLRLRGVTCLHASAVAIDDHAIAFVGPSGAGKSSTAAAFAQIGYPVLTDDVLALREDNDKFDVLPAYPRVRLWPESVSGLFGSAEALPRITPTWDKRFLDLNIPGYGFQATPLPLAAMYFLGERCDGKNAPFIQTVNSRTALMNLVSDTYGTRLLDIPRRAIEFDVLGRLVRRLPLRQIHGSTDLARLPELCRIIIDDYRHASSTAVDS